MYRSSHLKCRTIKSLGPEVGQSDRLPTALGVHAATCLRCQAEVARYRKLQRELGNIATNVMPAPAEVLAGVESAIGHDPIVGSPKATGRGLATIAGATAAAASMVAVAVWRRSRAVA